MFVAYLNDERAAYGSAIDDIAQYLEEARQGEHAIYSSSLTLAEINDRMLRNALPGAFDDFMRDFSGVVTLIDPSPTIMRSAGHLRGLEFVKDNGVRSLATPDAIHLSTAHALTADYGIRLDYFHTFDRGGAGRHVPILGLEDWCGRCSHDPVMASVLSMRREWPTHVSPRLSMAPSA